MNVLDICSGIGGFALAARKLDWPIIGFSEINPYSSKVLEQQFGNDNFHDAYDLGVSEANTSYAHLLDKDLVPCEELGHSTATYEDFMEGVLPTPDLVCAGSPCSDVTPASLTSSEGIRGKKSSTIEPIMDFLEDFESPYFVLENSSNIKNRGLCEIVKRLSEMNYCCEWETVSAAHFGFNHYRHRIYLVAYKKELACDMRIFDAVAAMACHAPDLHFPVCEQWTDEVLKKTYVSDPKSIKNRQARIDGLGNAVIPLIAYSVFRAIDMHKKYQNRNHLIERFNTGFTPIDSLPTTITSKGFTFSVLPARGVSIDGKVKELEHCPILNPSNRTYPNMTSTLLAVDRKNNFTTRSRLNRPGGLGGLVGSLMKMGLTEGALCPTFAEAYMGFPLNHTLLDINNKEITR